MINSVSDIFAPKQPHQAVAIFEVDDLLCVKWRMWLFLLNLAGPWRFLTTFLTLLPLTLQLGLRRLDRTQWRVQVLNRYLKGESVDHVEKISRRFVNRKLLTQGCPQGLQRLHWHKQQGHTTILVGHCPEVYLSIWGGKLGFDRVFGLKLTTQNRHYVGVDTHASSPICTAYLSSKSIFAASQYPVYLNGVLVTQADSLASYCSPSIFGSTAQLSPQV